MTYDYIIVGTGAAGAVLTERISASGENSVLVLEAGGDDRDLMHLIPKGWVFTMQNEKYIRAYETEPFGANRREVWPRGIIEGGSTTVNGLGWNTGEEAAYDWEQLGNHGWGWKAFRTALDKIENRRSGAAARDHRYGRMNVETVNTQDKFGDAIIASIADRGSTIVEDANLASGARVSYASSNTRRGLRRSAAVAFLRPALKRKNVTLIRHATVTRVIFSGTTAIGVEAEVAGQAQTFLAAREVILSAGSLESPLILERSGIGRREILEAAGIDVVADSPKVGENLSEHRGFTILFHLNKGVGWNHRINSLWRQAIAGVQFVLTRRGVISSGSFDIIAMLKLDADSPGADTQVFAAGISYGEGMQPEKGAGGLISGYPLFPTSRGSIHVTGPRHTDPPKIVTGYFETEYDREMLLKVVHEMRAIIESPRMQALGAQEYYPGTDMQSDEDIVRYALNYGPFGYHTLGACAIGPDQDDVVDNRLRVRGVKGLRVVDASIFPHQPSGNNSGPTSAAAWIAADLILEDAAHLAREKVAIRAMG